MNRIKNLSKYQQCILVFLTVLLIVFAVAYILASSREGFSYQDTILLPHEDNGTIVYSGRLKGEPASFTVTPDKAVTFAYGEKVYGPFTAKEDASAIPSDKEFSNSMTGVEIREGSEIFFRGGFLELSGGGPDLLLFHEDGSAYIQVTAVSTFGTVYDGDGNEMDPMEPSVYTILQLMSEPELTTKGAWPMWILGAFLSVITVISMLYADELFRWRLMFYVDNADQMEPSDWVITARSISWTVCSAAVLILYIWGLFI